MTYVEFFEKDAMDNIAACLSSPPERVIFVGDSRKLMEKHAQRYRAVMAGRGFGVEFICKSVNKNKMSEAVKALSQIVEQYDDCVFDITGGADVYLVALGMVFEKYGHDRVKINRFNIANNTVQDCDMDGQVTFETPARDITVEECVRLYGGTVVYSAIKDYATYIWQWSDEFRRDIDAMWEISCENVYYWNTQVGVLVEAEAVGESWVMP